MCKRCTSKCWIAIVFVLVGGCTPLRQVQHQVLAPQEKLIPDSRGRGLAAKMRTTPVEEIQFYGPHFYQFQDDPVRLQDQKWISEFQKALEQAQTRTLEVANRVDTMVIIYKPIGGKPVKPDYLNINITSVPDCFGPRFHKLVNDFKSYVPPKKK